MSITASFAGVAVADLEAMRAWYERLLGRAPDLTPNEREFAWKLSTDGWLYLVAGKGHPGTALLTLLVEDLDAQLDELAKRGIDPESLETLPNMVRKTEFVDPEGNRITYAQPTTEHPKEKR